MKKNTKNRLSYYLRNNSGGMGPVKNTKVSSIPGSTLKKNKTRNKRKK